MKFYITLLVTTLLMLSRATVAAAVSIPEIESEPRVLGQRTLIWPREGGTDLIPHRPFDYPDLTGQGNVLDDWHMQTSRDDWDLLVSTAGNFHRFLNGFFRQRYLPANPRVDNGQWGYSTSPPISIEQLENGGRLGFGNMEIRGNPMVVMGPNGIMKKVVAGGYAHGEKGAVLSNYGNVLLVRAGNPRNIQSIWDLGRPEVRLVTSNPETEPGSFNNYRTSIFHMAFHDARERTGNIQDAEDQATTLFNQIFNNQSISRKWVVGDRIHHRDVPQALADGEADAGIFFYHLARTAMEAHPGKFEIVPLGGTAENPDPMLGNRVATMFAIRIEDDLTVKQELNRDNFFLSITNPRQNARLLERYWVRQPVTTGNNQPPLPES
ncbi:MAG: substrate-binding domain-containing protein [Cyanobacteria bacterium P01_D01_bin.156]